MECKYTTLYDKMYTYPEKRIRFKCDIEALDSGYCIFHDPKFYEDPEHRERINQELIKQFDIKTESNEDILCIGYNLPDVVISYNFKNKVILDKTKFLGIVKIQSTFATDVSFKDCLFHNHASFSFSKFKDLVDFSRAKFMRFADFVKVEFQYTQFNKTEFKENGYFDHAIFYKHALFQGSSINNPFFSDAIFEEGVAFTGCNIEGGNLGAIYKGDVDFGLTKFHSDRPTYVYFGKATFSGRTRFEKCTFDTITYLNDISFTAEAEFKKCDFPLGVNFDGTVFSQISFQESKFGGPAYFRKSKFLAATDFKRVSFESLSDFSEAEFIGITDFSEAEFMIANFSHTKFYITTYFRTKFHETIFRDTVFVGETKFHFTFFEDQQHTIFNRVNLKNVSFLNTEISRIRFDSVRWGVEDGFKILEERMIEDKLGSNKEYQFDFNLDDVLTIYRNLRENYEFRLKYEEAGQFFVREMEIKRNYKED